MPTSSNDSQPYYWGESMPAVMIRHNAILDANIEAGN